MTRLTPKQKTLRNKKLFIYSVVFITCIFLALLAIFKFISFLKSSQFYRLNRINFVSFDKESRQALVFSIEGSKGYFFTMEPSVNPEDKTIKNYEKYFSSANILPVFGYLYNKNTVQNNYTSPALFLRVNLLKTFFGGIETNLNKSDLVNIFLNTLLVKNKDIEIRKKENLPTDFFIDAKIREEQYSIAVLNSTNETGLALNVAGFLEKAGGRVVRVTDWPEEKRNCEIILNDDSGKEQLKQSYTVFWLAKYYKCEVKYDSVLGQRAEITLILAGN